jgi:N-acetylneuraminic acid mutarotase
MFWTGDKVIVWGGHTSSCAGSDCITPYNTGGIYDPVTNRWSAISTTGAPVERRSYASAWTGKRMIIYGGRNLNRGALYDPNTNAWSAMSAAGAPEPLNQPSNGVWTGREFIVVGSTNDALIAAAYNPDTNAWAALPSLNTSNYRAEPSLVWSGDEAIIWGGYRYTDQGGYLFLNSGAKLHR